jgi:hypothetical protein
VNARLRLVAGIDSRARTGSTPAPKTYSRIGSNRVGIDVLCPEHAMSHFSFGCFLRRDADAVRIVRCPCCGGTHTLVSPQEWVATVGAGA